MCIMFHAYCIVHEDDNIRQDYIATLLKKQNILPVDIFKLDGEEVGIESIRRLISSLSHKPFASPYKAAVIDGNKTTLITQQALLKTLEEPPPHSLIIISVTHTDYLLSTIISRCHVIVLTSQNNASQIEVNKLESFWNNLRNQSSGQRLLLTVDVAPDRTQAVSWLTEQIIFWQQKMHVCALTEPQPQLTSKHCAGIIRQLLTALNQVKGNVSVKLAIDHLLLSLPKTTLK